MKRLFLLAILVAGLPAGCGGFGPPAIPPPDGAPESAVVETGRQYIATAGLPYGELLDAKPQRARDLVYDLYGDITTVEGWWSGEGARWLWVLSYTRTDRESGDALILFDYLSGERTGL